MAEQDHKETPFAKIRNETSYESISTPKSKIIRKCGPRKKTTKIVNTLIAYYTNSDGKIQSVVHTEIKDLNKGNKNLESLGLKSAQEHSKKIIDIHYSQLNKIRNNQSKMRQIQYYPPINFHIYHELYGFKSIQP